VKKKKPYFIGFFIPKPIERYPDVQLIYKKKIKESRKTENF
jgi:hypothetical protein